MMAPIAGGPIPACAGEPPREQRILALLGAYPRMRGGTLQKCSAKKPATGLSPHARGNLFASTLHIRGGGPIPACAGEPQNPLLESQDSKAYPRMRGGTGVGSCLTAFAEGLSPHARGNPAWHSCAHGHDGPIPACAGEPLAQSLYRLFLRAYPRMRGGTRGGQAFALNLLGLSPHARGNRRYCRNH